MLLRRPNLCPAAASSRTRRGRRTICPSIEPVARRATGRGVVRRSRLGGAVKAVQPNSARCACTSADPPPLGHHLVVRVDEGGW